MYLALCQSPLHPLIQPFNDLTTKEWHRFITEESKLQGVKCPHLKSHSLLVAEPGWKPKQVCGQLCLPPWDEGGDRLEFSPRDWGHPGEELTCYSSYPHSFLALHTDPTELPTGRPGNTGPRAVYGKPALGFCPQGDVCWVNVLSPS